MLSTFMLKTCSKIWVKCFVLVRIGSSLFLAEEIFKIVCLNKNNQSKTGVFIGQYVAKALHGFPHQSVCKAYN